MTNKLAIPQAIYDRSDELNALVENYPRYIPVPEVAKFLGANAEGLRHSIEHGQCPFGVSWKKTIHGNRAFKIPTLTFYLWYTQGGPFREAAKC